MDGLDITTVVEIIGLVLGGSGIGYLFTIKYARQQARGEARSAENEATKSVQDVYQEMVEDVKKDRQEQKEYIAELKQERQHLRRERDEHRIENENLHKRLNEMDEKVLSLEHEVARQGRKFEIINPFLCSRMDCVDRIRTSVHDLTAAKKKEKKQKKEEETKD